MRVVCQDFQVFQTRWNALETRPGTANPTPLPPTPGLAHEPTQMPVRDAQSRVCAAWARVVNGTGASARHS